MVLSKIEIEASPKPPTLRQLEKMHRDSGLSATPEDLALGLKNATESRWLLARYRGMVVGMARLEFHGHDFCHLSEVMVQKRFQHKGIGSAMLERVDAKCQRAGVELACLEPTGSSSSFYARCGFQWAPTAGASMFKRYRQHQSG